MFRILGNPLTVALGLFICLVAADSVFAQPINRKIVYLRGPIDNEDLWIMNADGSGQTKLCDCPGARQHTMSPDGNKVAFVRNHIVYVINADGTNLISVTPAGSTFSGRPSWAPNSLEFAFEASPDIAQGFHVTNIYRINADGTNLRQLTTADRIDIFDNWNPSWSPDGSRIAFQSDRKEHRSNSEIYVMSANGGGAMRLTNVFNNGAGFAGHAWAFWSPDSRRIVTIRGNEELCGNGPGEPAGLYILNADGTGPLTRITNCNNIHGKVVWSPDGKKLAFQQTHSIFSQWNLYTMNPDGSGKQPYFPQSSFAGWPNWSPDSKKLLISDEGELKLAGLDGTGMLNLTNTPTIHESTSEWARGSFCELPSIQTPVTGPISSSWAWNPQEEKNPNWSMTAQVSADDGLKLTDVMLGSRYLAKEISVPYYTLKTSNMFSTQRGELKPDSNDPSMRSRLIDYSVSQDGEKLVVEAVYAIDQINGNCLTITQRYEFYKVGVGGACEPSGMLTCSRWKPIVSYQFNGKNDTLSSINIVQKQHLTVDWNPYNTVGLFKDCDFPPECGISNGNTIPGIFGFEDKRNPLFFEFYGRAISHGLNSNKWDNIHQTYRGKLKEPPLAFSPHSNFVGGGCPECSHSHWRWGAGVGSAFGYGTIIGIPPGSIQDMDFAVVRYQSGEDDPEDIQDLVQHGEWIRTHNLAGRHPLQIHWGTAPEETVLWQSATGYQISDSFFGYGAFFSPALETKQLYVNSGSAPLVQGNMSPLSSGGDEIQSILASQIFHAEPVMILPFDASLGGDLPAGYTEYNNQSYDVSTMAESTGPYTVTFSLPSVPDQATFDNLRIFHLEQDEYDPDGFVWVDRTVLAPEPDGPDFVNKTISARTTLLGQFAVGLLTDPQPPAGAADLSVTIADSTDPIVTGNSLTYTVTVTNAGPDSATNVRLAEVLPPGANLVSFDSTQGTCKQTEGAVVCKLGTIESSLSAVVAVVVRLSDNGRPLTPQGESATSTAQVKSNEVDSNTANNLATETTTVIPDTNVAPTVTITSPATGNQFVGPATVEIAATASDSDGTISSVEFFDEGQSIGFGTSLGNNQYAFSWTNVGFGNHSLSAVATDNNSKKVVSNVASFFVNGPSFVLITKPSDRTAFSTPSDVVIEATATQSGSSISNVEFFANGQSIGTGTLFSQGRYRLTSNFAYTGTYSLQVAATNAAGVVTYSAPVTMFLTAAGGGLNQSPAVAISSPTTGSTFTSPANVTLTATATDADGSIANVVFYADGALLGTGTPAGSNQYTYTWVNPPIGNHLVVAVAADNRDAATNSEPIDFRVLSPALFVAGSTTLNSSDTAVKTRLEALNFAVTVKDHASVTTADATGKAIVVISSTVTPATVGTKFRTVAVPVITWESGLYSNMGMTGSGSQDAGTKTNQTQVSITNSTHPLAAAFPATVVVNSSSATANWGKPNANGVAIATVPGDAAKTTIFAYETGAVMPGLTAPARRVGLFMSDTSVLGADGTILVDAAILWASAISTTPTPGSLTATFALSPSAVNLTNEGTVDWAHWGRNSATAFNRKSNVTQRITNVTKIGAGELGWFGDNTVAYTWTGGTPTSSATNTTTGILTNTAVGNGFEMTIPADQTLRTLRLYVGVWNSKGRLEATLLDGSAPQYVDFSLDRNGGPAGHGKYEIKFKAGSPGQRLRVRFTIETLYFVPFGNVAWEAAVVRPGP